MHTPESAGVVPRRTVETASTPSRHTDFYPRLEALRGIAALSVAAFHAWQSRWIDSSGNTRNFLSPLADSPADTIVSLVLRIAGNGHGAVILFFVISGFVLTGSLMRGPQEPRRSATRFLMARLFRLYPAAIATIAVFAAVFWITGASLAGADKYHFVELFKNALLIETTINGVMWTLQLELIAGPLLLMAYFAVQRYGVGAAIVLFCVLAALSFWGPWTRAIGGMNMFGTIHAFIPGMIAFLVAPHLLKSCTPRTINLVLTIAATGFLASRPILGWASNWSVLAEAMFGAVAVAALAFGRPGGLATIFDWPLTRFFGRISYSFYLLHPLTLIVIWKIPAALGAVVAIGVPPLALAMTLFVASVAVVTPLASAMYRWVERPGVTGNRKLAKRLANHAATSTVVR